MASAPAAGQEHRRAARAAAAATALQALAQALRVNREDHERRRRTEELWQHLHLRGLTLMARRGVASVASSLHGWGVAAGS